MSASSTKRRSLWTAFVLVLFCHQFFAAHALANWPAGDMKPFALIVGNNDGGPGMQRLMYAKRDARKFEDVFVQLGHLKKDDVWTVLEGDADQVRQAMSKMDLAIGRAKDSGQRVLLIFYYSGHAVDGTLKLGNTSLYMSDVKLWLKNSSADVRIAFVDACQSGEMTRMKGGTLAPSMVSVDDTKGQIIVTSSAASEGSQESDEIGGSFFTHFLVSGLRGDADVSGDGIVSLREIYEYAYNRTVNRTANTRGGTQHPTYGYSLAGRGEIPLTTTYMLESGLLFPSELSGSYLVYNLGSERVAAELNKKKGEERFIAVPEGDYLVKKRREHDLLLGRLHVRHRKKTQVMDEELQPTSFDDDMIKGLVLIHERTWKIGFSLRMGAEAFFDSPTRDDLFYSSPQVGIEIAFIDLIARNFSLTMDLMFAGGEDDTQVELDTGVMQTVPTSFFRLQVGAGVYYRLDWSWFGLYGGPRLVLLMASRKFGAPMENYEAQTFGSLSPGLAMGITLHLGSWDVFMEGRVNYLYYNIDTDASLGFGGGYFGVAYRH